MRRPLLLLSYIKMAVSIHRQANIAVTGQGGVFVAGKCDDRASGISDTGQQDIEFIGFTAVGQGNKDIFMRYNAQVPVHGFHRMQKKGPGAGAVHDG